MTFQVLLEIRQEETERYSYVSFFQKEDQLNLQKLQ